MRDGHPVVIRADTTKRGSHASAPKSTRAYDRVESGESKDLVPPRRAALDPSIVASSNGPKVSATLYFTERADGIPAYAAMTKRKAGGT